MNRCDVAHRGRVHGSVCASLHLPLEVSVRKFQIWMLAGALVAMSTGRAMAQRRLAGRVTAATGEPLAAATVTVQGMPTGVTTGEDGRFQFGNVGDGSKVLTVRHFGYKRAVVTVTATQNEVNVALEKDVLQLESVVITGAATSVSSSNAAQAIT